MKLYIVLFKDGTTEFFEAHATTEAKEMLIARKVKNIKAVYEVPNTILWLPNESRRLND